ncbi:MAG: hypothetical protein AW07_00162 [Candidatus Accumulibacter sp. SK-11]|nr:MAG: hypothetical protein AW07_00162 [Candidatus Accumulibacter sp. SK-11]
MIVTMDKDPCLPQVVCQDGGKDRLQIAIEHGVDGQSEVSCQVPFGEQGEFASKQDMVVLGQLPGLAGELDADQRTVGIAVESWGCLAVRQSLQVGGAAEIGEEQEALVEVLRQHLGDVCSGAPEERRNLQERAAVFLFGRRVHDDPGARVRQGEPEIAPEAGIG